LLDDEAIQRVATNYLREGAPGWRLAAGREIADPPAVYFSAEPPFPQETYEGVVQFAVLRSDGQGVPALQGDIIVAFTRLLERHRLTLSGSDLEHALHEHWAEVVGDVLRDQVRESAP
jgi:hypothetical protein